MATIWLVANVVAFARQNRHSWFLFEHPVASASDGFLRASPFPYWTLGTTVVGALEDPTSAAAIVELMDATAGVVGEGLFGLGVSSRSLSTGDVQPPKPQATTAGLRGCLDGAAVAEWARTAVMIGTGAFHGDGYAAWRSADAPPHFLSD